MIMESGLFIDVQTYFLCSIIVDKKKRCQIKSELAIYFA